MVSEAQITGDALARKTTASRRPMTNGLEAFCFYVQFDIMLRSLDGDAAGRDRNFNRGASSVGPGFLPREHR